ncbi:glycosyltransferase family 2 protein [Fodinibius halophilus]|uniref:Glycosyltransferase n=1 Tax=Fodinibius halophilus TaxID=1736908 RepID=A0A6M1T2N2_9BACT|nr:glycosyltransferase [Fodinibius halophilus]NGP86873.1 glycosyltransferase [Fodinibius halophilus]
MSPRVSVVVRSINRAEALSELLEVLLEQKHDSYEIVVVEQSPDPSGPYWDKVLTLCNNECINLIKRKPLGGPKARNVGVSAAEGEIIILIDDDDLPLSKTWIRQHENAYEDPQLAGFTGRHVRAGGEENPYILPDWFIAKRCMSYSFLNTPYTYARYDQDVDNVDWLHGTNASLRRSVLKRVEGLWDTRVKSQDEHSFAFKLKDVLKEDEYIAFKTQPIVKRGVEIQGGMNKRNHSLESELRNHFDYIFKILATYRPKKFNSYYYLYLLWIYFKVVGWIWSPSVNISFSKRLKYFLQLPFVSWSYQKKYLEN